MDVTTPKGYLSIVERTQRPDMLIVQRVIEQYLDQGIPPREDNIIYITTNAECRGFPHEDIRKAIIKMYKKAGWRDIIFYKNAGALFTIQLILP
jgi:hypothetical protein